jgi:hypothetical protein
MKHDEWVEICDVQTGVDRECWPTGDGALALPEYGAEDGEHPVDSRLPKLKRPAEKSSFGYASDDAEGHENFDYLLPLLPDSSLTVSACGTNAVTLPPVLPELLDPAILQAEAPSTPPITTLKAYSPATPDGSVTTNASDFQKGSSEPPSFAIDCILKRWKKNLFLIRWLDDGFCWWIPRANILDEGMLRNFEANYQKFHHNIEKVLHTKKQRGKTKCRIR